MLCQNSLMQEDETFRLLAFSIMQTVLIDRQPRTSLYQLTPSLSKVRQLSWPKFMFPIIFFQFKMCQVAVKDAFHYQCTCDVSNHCFHEEHLSSTNSHRTSVFSLICCSVKTLKNYQRSKNVFDSQKFTEKSM